MNQSLPLHPAIVHLPLAIAMLMPLLSAAILWVWWRKWLPGRRVWTAVFVAQLLLGATAFAALRTGESEEEKVEDIVREPALEAHEEAANAFLVAALVVAVLSLLPLVLPNDGLRRSTAVVTFLATIAVAALAIRTGEAGGELVYQHGAAAAYTSGAGTAPSPSGRAARGWED